MCPVVLEYDLRRRYLSHTKRERERERVSKREREREKERKRWTIPEIGRLFGDSVLNNLRDHLINR